MKVFASETSQALARLSQLENTAKLTMWSKPVKKKKSCRDMVMSWTEKLGNAKKKSKPLTTLSSIYKSETKTTETNLCKELKGPIWIANTF